VAEPAPNPVRDPQYRLYPPRARAGWGIPMRWMDGPTGWLLPRLRGSWKASWLSSSRDGTMSGADMLATEQRASAGHIQHHVHDHSRSQPAPQPHFSAGMERTKQEPTDRLDHRFGGVNAIIFCGTLPLSHKSEPRWVEGSV